MVGVDPKIIPVPHRDMEMLDVYNLLGLDPWAAMMPVSQLKKRLHKVSLKLHSDKTASIPTHNDPSLTQGNVDMVRDLIFNDEESEEIRALIWEHIHLRAREDFRRTWDPFQEFDMHPPEHGKRPFQQSSPMQSGGSRNRPRRSGPVPPAAVVVDLTNDSDDDDSDVEVIRPDRATSSPRPQHQTSEYYGQDNDNPKTATVDVNVEDDVVSSDEDDFEFALPSRTRRSPPPYGHARPRTSSPLRASAATPTPSVPRGQAYGFSASEPSYDRRSPRPKPARRSPTPMPSRRSLSPAASLSSNSMAATSVPDSQRSDASARPYTTRSISPMVSPYSPSPQSDRSVPASPKSPHRTKATRGNAPLPRGRGQSASRSTVHNRSARYTAPPKKSETGRRGTTSNSTRVRHRETAANGGPDPRWHRESVHNLYALSTTAKGVVVGVVAKADGTGEVKYLVMASLDNQDRLNLRVQTRDLDDEPLPVWGDRGTSVSQFAVIDTYRGRFFNVWLNRIGKFDRAKVGKFIRSLRDLEDVDETVGAELIEQERDTQSQRESQYSSRSLFMPADLDIDAINESAKNIRSRNIGD